MNNPRRKDYLEDVLRKALRANLGTIEPAPKTIQLNYEKNAKEPTASAVG